MNELLTMCHHKFWCFSCFVFAQMVISALEKSTGAEIRRYSSGDHEYSLRSWHFGPLMAPQQHWKTVMENAFPLKSKLWVKFPRFTRTLLISSRGKSSRTFSGPIMYCSVTCQCVRVIWYLISSTRAAVAAIRTLPGVWRPTAYREREREDTSDVTTETTAQVMRNERGAHLSGFSLQGLV